MFKRNNAAEKKDKDLETKITKLVEAAKNDSLLIKDSPYNLRSSQIDPHQRPLSTIDVCRTSTNFNQSSISSKLKRKHSYTIFA